MDVSTQSQSSAPHSASTPRDVFAHLLTTIMLIVSVVSVVALAFQYVNIKFPDELTYAYTISSEIIRSAMAALIIAWPIYVYLMWILLKDVLRDPEKRQLKVRRWLFNFALFAAALTIIIDLISVLNNFLGGELTVRFALKTGSILVVAGSVFAYYLWDIKWGSESQKPVPRASAIAATIAVIAMIVAGFVVAGSPLKQRALRFDERRVNDLQLLQSEIINQWVAKEKLPESLEALKDSISGFVAPVDPETEQAYEYRVLGAEKFELCATFTLPSRDEVKGRSIYPYPTENWTHGAGRVCFERTIDPELYNKDVGPLKTMPF